MHLLNQALLATLVATAATASLGAQELTPPMRFVPESAQMVLRARGPAAWREMFGQTQLVKLLQGPTIGPIFEQIGDGFEQAAEMARTEGKVDVDAIVNTITGYEGEMVMALEVDLESVADRIDTDELDRKSTRLNSSHR